MTTATKIELLLVTSGIALACAVGLATLVIPARSMPTVRSYYLPLFHDNIPNTLARRTLLRRRSDHKLQGTRRTPRFTLYFHK